MKESGGGIAFKVTCQYTLCKSVVMVDEGGFLWQSLVEALYYGKARLSFSLGLFEQPG